MDRRCPTGRPRRVGPVWAAFILALTTTVKAYIPAVPINDTTGLNLTDSSTIGIAWQNPPGSYQGFVSFQLEADIPTGGQTQGALVHFTESTMGPNRTSQTPWIAFVSCDYNETEASNEWDIFTLARDRGAASALLYTTTSVSCLLNRHYIQDFEKPLDVFATKSAAVAKLIENQFRHTNQTFQSYNGDLLNSTFYGSLVNSTLRGVAPASSNETSFLVGTLTARNSTGNAVATDIPNSTPSSSSSTSSSSIPASMIVLYIVVGLIAICFITMLIMGWRRARRHPERYGGAGGEEGEGGAGGGVTARGIAQAMLDTFPVIKFRGGSGTRSGQENETSGHRHSPKRVDSDLYDLHDMLDGVYTPGRPSTTRSADSTTKTDRDGKESERDREKDGWTGRASVVASSSAPTVEGRSRPASADLGSTHHASVNGMALTTMTPGETTGTKRGEDDPDTCPICLLEFEEGDDLRVLPCEREHMYHQACIDPWLLDVSSSCPLCRKDFSASTVPSDDPSDDIPTASSSSASGFAKYLTNMRNKTRNRRRRANTSATNGSNGVGYSNDQLESVVGGHPRAGPFAGGSVTGGPGSAIAHAHGLGAGIGNGTGPSTGNGNGNTYGDERSRRSSLRGEEEVPSIVWGTPSRYVHTPGQGDSCGGSSGK